jgi:predicted nucleic acid-binding protein
MPNELIDTNILVYAYDHTDTRKNEIASKILVNIWTNGDGIITLQNLCEFFVIITKKVEQPIPIIDAKQIITDYIESNKWIKIDRSENTLIRAIEITENEKDFIKCSDIKVINPFA